MVIRAASVADVQEIAEFQTACSRAAYRDLVPSSDLDRVSAEVRQARWRARISGGARRVALGRVGEALVGVVSWGTRDEADVPTPELMSLYVAADHQGTGVASALLTHAIGHAPAHLWVFENNPRAHAFSVETAGTFDLDSELDL